ncbi:hypothetical protein C0991_010350 [Blastosporella zonata]|nr:hypothetical protein C0991_010350 [Blastosporella zonata]
MPISAQILLIVLAVLFIWFAITLATTKPPVRGASSLPSSLSPKSSTITLVDSEEPSCDLQKAAPSKDNDEESDKFIIFENPFADVNSPVRISRSPSLALHPFARRMSMPGRCTPHLFCRARTPLREHAVIIRHGSLAEDGESYFGEPQAPSGKHRVIRGEEEKHEKDVRLPVLESRVASSGPAVARSTKKTKKFTKRLTSLFRHHKSSHT